MTTFPETAPQPRKSSADFTNWRATYPAMSEADAQFWNMMRKRSQDSLAIGGMMPFTFDPNRLVGPPTAANPAPGGAMPSPFDIQQSIRPGTPPIPGMSLPAGMTMPTFTPQMQTDLLGALQSLTSKPGFEQLSPLLALLGKG